MKHTCFKCHIKFEKTGRRDQLCPACWYLSLSHRGKKGDRIKKMKRLKLYETKN